jgi:YesN/AraC family two-component response regulator
MTELAKNEPEKPVTKADVKSALKNLADKLDKQEGQKRSGARSRLPKGRMLDASAIEKKDPEHYYRYENTDDPGKMQTQIDAGFEAVPEKECDEAGVRHQVGELRLIRQPMEDHEEEVRASKELNKRRLEAHKTEVYAAAESVQKELRDRYGMDIPLNRLLVDE